MVERILFEQVEDSRQDWKVKHSVSKILTIVMCGVSAGERSIYGIRELARLKEQWLTNVIGLKLPNGLPSYFDKGHGRTERRIYTLDTQIGWFEDKKQWKHLAVFGMVESIVTRECYRCKTVCKGGTQSLGNRE